MSVQDQTPEDRIKFLEQQLEIMGNMDRTMTVRIQNMGAETAATPRATRDCAGYVGVYTGKRLDS